MVAAENRTTQKSKPQKGISSLALAGLRQWIVTLQWRLFWIMNITQYLKTIGARGGKSRSLAKQRAGRRNAAKARAAKARLKTEKQP